MYPEGYYSRKQAVFVPSISKVAGFPVEECQVLVAAGQETTEGRRVPNRVEDVLKEHCLEVAVKAWAVLWCIRGFIS